jgi:hypothetical protein
MAVNVADYNPIDAASGPQTFVLPTGVTPGTVVSVEKIDSSRNAVTIVGSIRAAGEEAQPVLSKQYELREYVADTSSLWRPIGRNRLKPVLDGYATRTKRLSSLFPGSVPVGAVSRVATANQPVQSSTGTFEVPVQLACKATNLRLLIVNSRVNGTTDSTASVVALTLTAGLNVGTQAAPVVYPLTVAGQTQFTVSPGGFVLTDPLPIDIDPASVTLRARINVVSGNWYPNAYTQVAGGGGTTSATDLTATNTAITEATSATYLFAPAAVFGEPLGVSSPFPSALIVGDSIANSQYDGLGVTNNLNTVDPRLGAGGFLMRGLSGRAGLVNIATPSETATGFLTFANRKFRALFLNACATMFCQYGFNDLFNSSRTAAQLQTDLIAIWTLGSSRCVRVYQTTITPQNASTDGFMSNLTQANSGAEAYRVTVNQWLRDGAPIQAGAAVAAGTVGDNVSRCNVFDQTGAKVVSASGPAGHPLYGSIDVASTVETATDSGLWKAAVNKRSVADTSMTNGSQTVTSATAVFVQANDRGRVVTVAGAGSAGALYKAVIQNVSSATTATGGNGAGTTVTNAATVIGESFVYDGTHPTSFGHAAMAAPISQVPLAY